jgi:circadian clock protein KaiC
LYENIMLLEYVQRDGVSFREISVLKLRENGYDMANHVLTISDNGITVSRPGLSPSQSHVQLDRK